MDHRVGVQGHGRDIFDILTATEKRFISMLMVNVQLNGSKGYNNHMTMYITTYKEDVSTEK